ncbi:hypothetical protein AGMMS50239_38660 [Bacteroidia bacterium]|nr:hypothetical protein AGMMS50239_38660 [Bacteroidia bacterium]
MKNKICTILLGIMALSLCVSCEDYLTVVPDTTYTPAENAYKKADDALTALYGVYALLQPLADRIFLIGEAQGDLVVAARGADKYIAEFAQNRVSPQNPYTDYTAFYRAIIACNSAMKGMGNIRKVDPVYYSQEKYEMNIAEIMYVRAWLYLQLVKIWKDVPYLGNDVTVLEQLHETAPESRENILKYIQKDVEEYASLVYRLRLPGSAALQDLLTSRTQITQQAGAFLRAEIYLYQDNLPKAWATIRPYLPYGEYLNNNGRGISVGISNGGNRYWDDIIGGTRDREALFSEWVWYIDYDASKGQTNHLQYWTDNENGGVYALKPSSNAINWWNTTEMMYMQFHAAEDRWFFTPRWNKGAANRITDGNGKPIVGHIGDMTRGENGSYYVSKGDTIIFKYLMKEWGIKRDPARNDAKSQNDPVFWLYRSGTFFQLVCEIMNNMGMHTEAVSIIGSNTGAASTRARVMVCPLWIDPQSSESEEVQVNRFILEEAALEGAFEGVRWFDLVRFSTRPGYESWVGDYVSKKYPAAQQAEIKARLSDPNHWYLPYYYINVDKNPHLNQKSGYN